MLDHKSVLNEQMRLVLKWLADSRFYGTLSQLARCKISIEDTPGFVAAINLGQAPFKIMLSPKLLTNLDFLKFALIHELRHIPQVLSVLKADPSVFFTGEAFKDKTEQEKKILFRILSNQAMDFALHEDLRRLFSEETAQAFKRWVKEEWGIEICFVSEPTWARDQSWPYYLMRLAEKVEFNYQAMDSMDFGDGEGTEGEKAESLGRIQKELDKSESLARQLANSIGQQIGDLDLFLPDNPLSDRVKQAIDAIRIKTERLTEDNKTFERTWSSINRRWPGGRLPGTRTTVEKSPALVVVLDTSGSVVCDPNHFGALRGCLIGLREKGTVLAAYCCDVALLRMESDTQVKGGGGTAFEISHVEEIRKDLSIDPEEPLTIVYVTDGDVNLSAVNKLDNLYFEEVII